MARKTGIAVIASLVLMGAVAGCGSTTPTSTSTATSSGPKTGGTLNVGISSDFVTLNPAMSSALIDRQAFINLLEFRTPSTPGFSGGSNAANPCEPSH